MSARNAFPAQLGVTNPRKPRCVLLVNVMISDVNTMFRTRVSFVPQEPSLRWRPGPRTRVSARLSAGRARGPMTGWTRAARAPWVTTSPSTPAPPAPPVRRVTGPWRAGQTRSGSALLTAPRGRHRTLVWSPAIPVLEDTSRTRARPTTATSAPTRRQQPSTPLLLSETASDSMYSS